MNGTHTATKIRSWWVFIPAATLALFNTVANASNNTGLHAVYYQIDEVPPVKNVDVHTVCGSEIENNLNRSFDGEPFEPCPNDMFMVRYTGYITVPAHDSIRFWLAADDGGTMNIDGYEWGTWDDKGCTAIETDVMTLQSDTPLPLEGWFYENGGGTCFMLAWDIDSRGWEIVPDDAFTVSAPPTTTTTELTTTTTVEPTTTTAQLSTTTVYSSSTTIAATTSTITAPSTTQPISTTSPSSSTTVDTTTTVETTLPSTTTTAQPSPTTTQPLDLVLSQPIDQNTAVALATDSATLEVATQAQAEQIFNAIDIGSLSDGEVAAIVDAVQDAPTTVREAFEQEIDIYGGATDSYVPLGSLVNVATRRMLVVSVAFTIAMPIAPSRRS